MSENSRLETFCDGVFAIAITLLILEIKVPPVESVHSIPDVWQAIEQLWPSAFAFGLSFIIITIAWVNHHAFFKVIDKSSPLFMFVNAFFLLTLVILPFPTAFMAEYLRTDYAQPAIVLYCAASLFHNIGWMLLFETSLRPKNLIKNAQATQMIKRNLNGNRLGFVIYAAVLIAAWWFPYTALVVSCLSWFMWIFLLINSKVEDVKEVVAVN